MDTRGHCWYQSSSSSGNPVEEKNSTEEKEMTEGRMVGWHQQILNTLRELVMDKEIT